MLQNQHDKLLLTVSHIFSSLTPPPCHEKTTKTQFQRDPFQRIKTAYSLAMAVSIIVISSRSRVWNRTDENCFVTEPADDSTSGIDGRGNLIVINT